VTAAQALMALVVACVAIVVGVALLWQLAWALIVGGVLLLMVTVLLYDSQTNQRNAIERKRRLGQGL
jgi:hypothetical protein